ncbi:MAG: phenylalanine--tRNA ligase subunit beta [Bacteroidales bacterium]|nr:phenylalanine--tRNA ligase subunit beta [Bacteroidales bacterium]
MKISLNWLKQYTDLNLPAEKISRILTDLGLEVEGMETFESVKGGMLGLVIGEVLTCSKHPNADKLTVTTVDVGQEQPLQIVCGAPNVAEGQKVVVATVGAQLFFNEESITIKKTKLRGELSEGMICAEDEIGLGTGHDGIMVLEKNAKPGTAAKEYFNVESDTVFEIGLTPNRIDGASHYGTARDLAAFFSQEQKVRLELPDISFFAVENNSYPVQVIIENPDACNRYAGITLTGISVKPSPEWLQTRLRSIGLNPINNIVDITNFVLHELGQPLHAFDADKIRGKKIVVKNQKQGTKFTTLDGEEHELSAEDLMICDGEGPVAIAGAFGGLDSGVTDSTKNVFIESAYFNPVSVRKTARLHGISTDSSFRFERGVDPNMTLFALKRAALLMKELGGGTIASEIVDVYPRPIKDFEVAVSYKNIDRLIGKHIHEDKIKKILNALEIKILKEDDKNLVLKVPAYRVDVTREADVTEEILRIYGYNNIEIPEHLNSNLAYTKKPDNEKLMNLVSDFLSARGFNEIMSNSLTKSNYYKSLETYRPENTVKIFNPLSHDLDGMRQTLLFGGLEAIIYNTNRRNPDLMLYEFGNCYALNVGQSGRNPLDKYSENRHLGLFLTGNKSEPNWTTREEKTSFYRLKSYVENIFQRLGLNINTLETRLDNLKPDIFEETFTYSINNKVLAELGYVNPSRLQEFDIANDVFYADIFWDTLVSATENLSIRYEELPKYPEVRRDLALLLDQAVNYSEIKKLAYETEKNLLKKINLFDVFQGKNIPEGKKSYAVSFILQDKNKTLSDKEIDKIMQRLISVYQAQLHAEIR